MKIDFVKPDIDIQYTCVNSELKYKRIAATPTPQKK